MKKPKKSMPKVDPYVEGLMGKLLDRLVTIERKMDVVISKVSQKTIGNAQTITQVSQPTSPPMQPRREKTLYEAICAECSKVCEVPFRPTENRPVYCKECWSKRRGQGHGMPMLTPVSLPPKPVSKLGLAPISQPTAGAKIAKKTKTRSSIKKMKRKK